MLASGCAASENMIAAEIASPVVVAFQMTGGSEAAQWTAALPSRPPQQNSACQPSRKAKEATD